MSLIDIRNFAAPIRDRLILGTIVIAGLLVWAVRWGTSGDAGARPSPTLPREASRSLEELQRDLLSDDDGPSSVGSELVDSPPEREREMDGMLRGLLDNENGDIADRSQTEAASELEDLRRSLDLH